LAVGEVNGLLGFLQSLFTEVVIRVSLQSGLIGLKRFVVLLEEEVAISLFVIGLDEVRIFLKSEVIVLFGPLELHQLDIDLSNVAVVLGSFWISLHCFLVFLQSLWEFA
jgi:hypothetical protein